ncbi:unnamed protein product [Brugia pahangi]|uniref:Uncharacterized protein n=1 Tax=Brugia pahangi TaxID=6280 RepID=A0A0N4TDQ2_BRUPA|nr:unnamed protein product [Brugia pahangi]
MENIRCPFAKMEDDLEIGDFRIFASSEMNEEKKLTQKLQEKSHNEEEKEERGGGGGGGGGEEGGLNKGHNKI